MYFARRVCVPMIFVCGSMLLLAGRVHSQTPSLNVYRPPEDATCKAAISAKIQTDHGASANFGGNSLREVSGNVWVQGTGDYLSGIQRIGFNYTCAFNGHSNKISFAAYSVEAVKSEWLVPPPVDSERLVPPENQAQDCQDRIHAKIIAGDGWEGLTDPKSIESRTNKKGDRVIYGTGRGRDGRGYYTFHCVYRDGRLITLDYW